MRVFVMLLKIKKLENITHPCIPASRGISDLCKQMHMKLSNRRLYDKDLTFVTE